MQNNFFPLSAEELLNRINNIPRIKLAMLPTALEYLPNISNDIDSDLHFLPAIQFKLIFIKIICIIISFILK